MLDLQLKYDPDVSIIQHITSSTTDVMETASALVNGMIPMNFLQNTMKSSNYRDAVINTIITKLPEPDTESRQTVLELLSACISSVQDEQTEILATYSEYAASIALSWGETKIATQAILRNNPKTSSNFLKTIASAIDKNMDHSSFNNLLANSTANARGIWETVERPVLFPAG